MLRLRIEKEGPDWVLIDKPAGFHSHPPEDPLVRLSARRNALGILERQRGVSLAPAHRLDRAASGLLIYAQSSAARRAFHDQFAAGEVRKLYYVLVRGEAIGACNFREALRDEKGREKLAATTAEPCFSFTLPLPHPRGGGDRRFTVLAVRTETGRFHQIRRHFAQAGLPLVGDSRHGDRRLNREFAALTGLGGLFLRCLELEFRCPDTGLMINARARWTGNWHQLFDLAGICAI